VQLHEVIVEAVEVVITVTAGTAAAISKRQAAKSSEGNNILNKCDWSGCYLDARDENHCVQSISKDVYTSPKRNDKSSYRLGALAYICRYHMKSFP
jgi:hypothetical protein